MHRRQSLDIPSVARGKHDKDGRQVCLIEAATQVFAEYGYDAATTREVAERAGCSEGLIHRYFGGKRGLLIAILDRKAETMTAERRSSLPARASLLAEVEQLLLWPLDQYWQNRSFMRVSVSQAAIDRDVGRTIGDRVNRVHVEFIAERLHEHAAAGRLRPDVDIEATAMAISALNVSLGFFAQVAFEMDRDELQRQTGETVRSMRGRAIGSGSSFRSSVTTKAAAVAAKTASTRIVRR